MKNCKKMKNVAKNVIKTMRRMMHHTQYRYGWCANNIFLLCSLLPQTIRKNARVVIIKTSGEFMDVLPSARFRYGECWKYHCYLVWNHRVFDFDFTPFFMSSQTRKIPHWKSLAKRESDFLNAMFYRNQDFQFERFTVKRFLSQELAENNFVETRCG